ALVTRHGSRSMHVQQFEVDLDYVPLPYLPLGELGYSTLFSGLWDPYFQRLVSSTVGVNDHY
ncbi:hypothetical protein OFC04_25140, partial [Escherichia coli]|nr:hypothetical protein [Escherichia coli]